jgi:nitrite reductase/ring-hydroxylating ferredoxin subunit
MSYEDRMSVAIARTDELRPGQTKKFVLDCGGREVEGFLVNAGGGFHAYVNQCRHVPMGLDWVENQFFTADGQFLQCATHGAFYVPDTGECIAGPPCGKSLTRIPIRDEDGTIVASCPPVIPD